MSMCMMYNTRSATATAAASPRACYCTKSVMVELFTIAQIYSLTSHSHAYNSDRLYQYHSLPKPSFNCHWRVYSPVSPLTRGWEESGAARKPHRGWHACGALEILPAVNRYCGELATQSMLLGWSCLRQRLQALKDVLIFHYLGDLGE